MKYLTFDYEKLNGEKSHRKLLVLGQPSDKYSGIDVTSASDEDVALCALDLFKLNEKFKADKQAILEKYDLAHNHRQFFSEKMTNVVTDNVL